MERNLVIKKLNVNKCTVIFFISPAKNQSDSTPNTPIKIKHTKRFINGLIALFYSPKLTILNNKHEE